MRHLVTERSNHSSLISIATVPSIVSRCIQITYTNIASFKNLSSFSTWLYRIAYNIFYDYVRSRKEAIDLNASEVDKTYSVEQENIGQKIDIYASLKTLKETERTCITLFYMEDLSIDKIAGILNCPQGTVKSHLARAKEKLSDYLKQNGYDRNR